ncbi:MAG: sirohydrochlorin cobaltochelatase [Selenomonadaceae bacterium]|nr:sirohydrochlorin cobaltochelatase [Selenomonadaceae bacterium]
MENDNSKLFNGDSACAILLTSFGSADDKIRATTFDALATELEKKFPAFEVRQAFTSNFMIRKIVRRGIFIATPSEEISRLRGEGCRKIFLLPTHLTPGEEFDNKIKICAAPDVEIIPPLLSEPLDKKIFATILNCYPRAEDENLILIGHGSPNRHNPVYERLQTLAGDNVHIGVIEATDTPNFDDVVKRLKISRAEKILLAPLLFNGGVHVAEDIAGDDSGSWLNRLTALGYKVRVIRDGLGTFKNFRKLYIDRLEEKIGRTQA